MGIATTPDCIAEETLPPDDAEADEPEKGPLRRCIVTRERLPREAMIRFVIGPDRVVVPDLAARLPGRGIWLSARWDVIETARGRGGFARAARGQVTVPPNLTLDLKAALARRVGDTLGLARRAGQAVCGYTKARAWLENGRAGLVIQASDGSPEERSRFLGAFTPGASGGREQAPGLAVLTPLDGAALGAVFGREHAVHVAVARGRLAERLGIEAGRLAGLIDPATTRQDGKPGKPGVAT